MGNRVSELQGITSTTYSYAAASQRLLGLSGFTTRSYSYDAVGNATAQDSWSFTYG